MNVHCSRPFTIGQNTTDAAADDDDHDDDVAVIKQASTRSFSNYRFQITDVCPMTRRR